MNEKYAFEAPSVIPDGEEHKALRKHYFAIAFIPIVLVLVFNGVNYLVISIASGIIGGGFTKEALEAGREIIRNNEVMAAIYSYGFPLAADFVAFAAGLAITGADIKKRITWKGFTGGEMAGFTSCAMTFALAGSMIMMFIIGIIALASGKNSPFTSADDAVDAVSIVSGSNPLWLDIMIYSYVCLLGPIMEELIFRGVLLEGLRKYGNRFGIIMSAVMFGLMHQNFTQFIPAMFMGLVFASMTVRSGSLIPSIFAHILNNTLSAIMMVMMQDVPLDELASGSLSVLGEMVPFLITMSVYLLFRLACVVVCIVFMVKYFGNHGKLIGETEYTRRRTWKYLFTSVPWILVMGWMLFGTVTSVL